MENALEIPILSNMWADHVAPLLTHSLSQVGSSPPALSLSSTHSPRFPPAAAEAPFLSPTPSQALSLFLQNPSSSGGFMVCMWYHCIL
jgi:hypothetical protein